MPYDALFFTVTTVGDTAVSAANPLPVTIPATAAGFVHLEDAASANGDGGVAVLAIRDDTLNIRSGTEGDYEPLHTDSEGALWTHIANITPVDMADGGPTQNAIPMVLLGRATNVAIEIEGVEPDGDGKSEASALATWSQNALYNASTWDRQRSIINATNSTGTGIQAAGLVAQFDDTSPTAITENSFGNLRMSVTHDLRTSFPVPEASAVIAPSKFSDLGSLTKESVKASAGNVFSISVSNANAAVRYFQLHNKASDPAATEVPVLSIPIPAGTAAAPTVLILGSDYFAPSFRLSTGVAWAISTTLATFTDSATGSEHVVTMMYS